MNTDNLFKKLWNKWKKFIEIVLAPGSIIPIIIAAISLYVAFTSAGRGFSIFLSIFASVITAIAGLFIKDDWEKMRGNTILEKKGSSAIRNLSAIGQQIFQIKTWIKTFTSEKSVTKEGLKRELEEIDRHITTMEMNIKAGLQDWTDIVPELKETEEVARAYESVVKKYLEELLKNKKELLGVGENKELKEKLESRIKELEKNVRELKKEQPHMFNEVGTGIDSFISVGGGGTYSNLFNTKICSKCGKSYNEDSTPTASNILNRNLCPECRKRQ